MTPEQLEVAACRGADTALFFPTGTRQQQDRQRVSVAAEFCHHCPVVEPCREAGRTESGIWGGDADLDHGNRTAYNAGCRCLACRMENAAYARGRRSWIGPRRTYGNRSEYGSAS